MRALGDLAFTRYLPVIPAYSDSGRRLLADLGVDGDSVFVVQDSGRGTTGRWGQGARGDPGGRLYPTPALFPYRPVRRNQVRQHFLKVPPIAEGVPPTLQYRSYLGINDPDLGNGASCCERCQEAGPLGDYWSGPTRRRRWDGRAHPNLAVPHQAFHWGVSLPPLAARHGAAAAPRRRPWSKPKAALVDRSGTAFGGGIEPLLAVTSSRPKDRSAIGAMARCPHLFLNALNAPPTSSVSRSLTGRDLEVVLAFPRHPRKRLHVSATHACAACGHSEGAGGHGRGVIGRPTVIARGTERRNAGSRVREPKRGAH